MENVERTHFVVLTGHLDDRPLPDLMRTLRVQRKSGRLQVEYPDAPAAFFFEEGQLVDAQLGNLRGVEALYAALALPGASFNFNPLVRPPERSIDRQGQKFVQDLIETPRRNNLSELRVVGRELSDANASPLDLPPAAAAPQLPPAPQTALVRLEPAAAAALTAPLEARLTAVEAAIEHTSRRFSRERLVYLVVISFLVGVTVTTAVQAIGGLRRRASEAAAQSSQPAAQREASGAAVGSTGATSSTNATGAVGATNATSGATNATDGAARANGQNSGGESRGAATNAASSEADAKRERVAKREQSAKQSQVGAGVAASEREPRKSAGGYVVDVLMEVKGGRVTEARVLNPRPGGGAYEALALRMARQRRYPDNFTGADTWKIRVKP